MTNWLTLIAALVLMLFYLFTFVFRERVPILAAVGLTLLTLGMLIDGLYPVYWITTGIAALASWWGVRKPP